MAKANANYKKLADDAEVRRDGFKARVVRARTELGKLLDGNPERDKIMEMVGYFARADYDLSQAEETFARYVALRDTPPKLSVATTPAPAGKAK